MSFALAHICRTFIYALGAGAPGERPRFCRNIPAARQRVRRVEQIEHARVFDAVIHPQAVFAILDQSGLAEKHQLLGDVRLALAKEGGQMTHALFARAQRVEQAHARGMRERAEQLGRWTVCLRHDSTTIFRFLNIVYPCQVKIEFRSGHSFPAHRRCGCVSRL